VLKATQFRADDNHVGSFDPESEDAVRRRAGRSERGASLVEGAIVAPVVFLLIFAVFEFGLLFKDYLSMSAGIRDSARLETTVGSSTTADYEALQNIKKRTPALDVNDIIRIVVFKASGPNSDVPVACKTGSVTNVCNSYTKADLARPKTDFTGSGSAPDRFWAPSSRKDRLSDPPDYVGVWMKINHKTVTSFVPLTKDLEDTIVMRIEPSRS